MICCSLLVRLFTSGALALPRPILGGSKDGESMISLETCTRVCHPHGEEAFPDALKEPPVFLFVPRACCPTTGHHGEDPGCLFAPSLQTLMFPPSLFFSRLNSPNSLSVSSWEKCSSSASQPFVGLSPCLSSWGAPTGIQYSGCGLTSAEQRGRILSLTCWQRFGSPGHCSPSLSSWSTWW